MRHVADRVVSVPVLSSTTASTCAAPLSGTPPLITSPRRAALPIDALTAVGVARPAAHGQATISMVTLRRMSRVSTNTRPARRNETGFDHTIHWNLFTRVDSHPVVRAYLFDAHAHFSTARQNHPHFALTNRKQVADGPTRAVQHHRL